MNLFERSIIPSTLSFDIEKKNNANVQFIENTNAKFIEFNAKEVFDPLTMHNPVNIRPNETKDFYWHSVESYHYSRESYCYPRESYRYPRESYRYPREFYRFSREYYKNEKERVDCNTQWRDSFDRHRMFNHPLKYIQSNENEVFYPFTLQREIINYTPINDGELINYTLNSILKLRNLLSKISAKSLKKKCDVTSINLDLETNLVSRTQSLERILIELNKKGSSSFISGVIGEILAEDNINLLSDNSSLDNLTNSLSKEEQNFFLIALIEECEILTNIKNEFFAIRKGFNFLRKKKTTKLKFYYFQITPIFISFFHFIDMIGNIKKINEFINNILILFFNFLNLKTCKKNQLLR